MLIRFGACSDVGRQRRTNEDSYVADPGLRLFAVADGMGGHVAGEIASKTVVDGVHEFIRETSEDQDKTWPFEFDRSLSVAANRLRIAILVANQRLSHRIDVDQALRGTGSTLAAVLFEGESVVVSNVGDCRVYRVRDGEITRITRDHSWVAEQVRAGFITEAEARVHPWRHMVTRSVSGETKVAADLLEADVRPDDRFLLCSDGVHGLVTDDELLRIVMISAGESDACRAVIGMANSRGGPDNATAVIVSILSASSRPDDAGEATADLDTVGLAKPAPQDTPEGVRS